MEQYIPKSALVAEIENLLKPVKQRLERDKNDPWDSDIAVYKFGIQLIKNIDTFEVKEVQEGPVSEDSKKHVSLVTERMLKEGPIPTLIGKEKADFENEFNRFKQITGMINWPSREEIYKNVILWFIAWSKEHLKIGDIVDKSEVDKQFISDDLEKAANEWDAKASFTPFYMALDDKGNPYEIRQDYTTHAESFKAGAKWKHNQMMAKAINARCFGFQSDALFSFKLPANNYLVGSEVKVIVIKK